MSKTLKRPMFRRGGTVNDGIMTGIVDRTKHAENPFVTGIAKRTDVLAPEFQSILEKYTPQTKIPYGAFGLDIATGTPIGEAFKKRYTQFTTADDAREKAVKTGAAKLALNQAMTEAKPNKTSVLAAEKKARFLLPPNASAEQIRAKTAEIIQSEMRGKTYGAEANLERAISSYRGIYGEGSKAFNHAAFDIKVAPALRAAGKNPRSNIKFKDGKYKTKGKSPGVYIDVENGKVIEFDGNIAKELPEYSALLR
jgi:hypothetical protein